MKNLFRYHLVKLIMLLATGAVFAEEAVKIGFANLGAPEWMLCVLMLFQIRGIAWEESYRAMIYGLRDEVKKLMEKK